MSTVSKPTPPPPPPMKGVTTTKPISVLQSNPNAENKPFIIRPLEEGAEIENTGMCIFMFVGLCFVIMFGVIHVCFLKFQINK